MYKDCGGVIVVILDIPADQSASRLYYIDSYADVVKEKGEEKSYTFDLTKTN